MIQACETMREDVHELRRVERRLPGPGAEEGRWVELLWNAGKGTRIWGADAPEEVSSVPEVTNSREDGVKRGAARIKKSVSGTRGTT